VPNQPYQPVAAPLARGSLIILRRKCGTPTCSCAKGRPHESPALSYSIAGATKMLTLRPQDVREVRAALKRYQKAVQALEREALAGIHSLRQKFLLQKAAGKARR
jgi:hypothetical protein